MQAAFDHRQLVIAGRRIAADFHKSAQQLGRLGELLVFGAQVRQFQQRFGKIRIRLQRILKHGFGLRVVALALFDEANVEQARGVARIEFQALLEVFSPFVEAAQVSVGKAHERVRSRRRIEFNQLFEFLNRALRLARHEVALAQCRVKIGALRSNLQSRLKQRNRVLKIILRHAHARHQENDVGILGSQFARANQQIERVHGTCLVRHSLRHQVKSFGGFGLQLQRAVQRQLSFRIFTAAQIRLPQVVKDFKRFRLQRVRGFKFHLCRFVLLLGRQQHAKSEM